MGNRILDIIKSPADLKVLTDEELGILAQEIRDEIIQDTSITGGHVASSLGAVEIILAVHSLIDSPTDKFIFDIGHQAYAHKIVTGRLEEFKTLRQLGGISGFPRPDESPYDVHPSGHASDSLSIAYGMARARDLRGTHEKIVTLIGDASISGGMAFEALNSIGQDQSPMVIILNDNEMSISRTAGALISHFGNVRASSQYRNARDYTQERLEESGPAGKAVVNFGRSMKKSLKEFVLPNAMIFEHLGFLCTPPIDGHNIADLRRVLRTVLDTDCPVLMHVVTKKGAGYEPAVQDPERFHGVGPFDIATGASTKPAPSAPSYTHVFGEALLKEAQEDERIVGITAAMESGTGLSNLAQAYPKRFIDAGIAEGHAVGTAAGLAFAGMKPVVAIYSTFLQRALDQVIVDNALMNLDVVFAIDRAGLVGADGPTHHGVFDIAYTRMIPNLRVLAPSNEEELVHALHTALKLGGPFAIRYPRGEGEGVPVPKHAQVLEVGKSLVLRQGTDVTLLAFGRMVHESLKAADILEGSGISTRVVDMRWVKPLDLDAIREAGNTKLVVTLEEGVIEGGIGEEIGAQLEHMNIDVPLIMKGIPDTFVEHGKITELFEKLGLDALSIAREVQAALA